MSQYAQEIHRILASLSGEEDEDATPLPEEEDLDAIHVYPVEGGGILLTRTPLDEEEEAAALVIESQPATVAPRTPSSFVLFLLLLCLFLVGDLADTQLIALMTRRSRLPSHHRCIPSACTVPPRWANSCLPSR